MKTHEERLQDLFAELTPRILEAIRSGEDEINAIAEEAKDGKRRIDGAGERLRAIEEMAIGALGTLALLSHRVVS